MLVHPRHRQLPADRAVPRFDHRSRADDDLREGGDDRALPALQPRRAGADRPRARGRPHRPHRLRRRGRASRPSSARGAGSRRCAREPGRGGEPGACGHADGAALAAHPQGPDPRRRCPALAARHLARYHRATRRRRRAAPGAYEGAEARVAARTEELHRSDGAAAAGAEDGGGHRSQAASRTTSTTC